MLIIKKTMFQPLRRKLIIFCFQCKSVCALSRNPYLLPHKENSKHQTITLSISHCTATDKSAPISVLPSSPPYLPSSILFFLPSFVSQCSVSHGLCALDRPGLCNTHIPNCLLIWLYQSSALHLVSLIFLSMMAPSIKHIWESFSFKQWLLFP